MPCAQDSFGEGRVLHEQVADPRGCIVPPSPSAYLGLKSLLLSPRRPINSAGSRFPQAYVSHRIRGPGLGRCTATLQPHFRLARCRAAATGRFLRHIPPPPSMPARASLADRERRAVPAPSLSWLRMRRRWLPPRRGVIAVRPPSSLSPAATRPRPGRADRRGDGLRSQSDSPSLVRAVALRPALLPKLFSYAR